MSNSGFSLVTPLNEAHNARLIGGKAARLARLHSGSYMVPRGFVISADAYRLHLWKSGVKPTDLNVKDPTSQENIRQAILDSPIPDEVTEAISEAYRTLGMHVGYQTPQVIARPSIIEIEPVVRPERRVYSHVGPTAGIAEVMDAIKTVWASTWSVQACARRNEAEDNTDPSMAVLVQDYINCILSGAVRTADIISGRPNVARLMFSNPNTPTDRHSAVFNLDTLDFEDSSLDHETMSILNAAVDKAIMLESNLDGSAYMEWGWDGKWIWLFQADPLGPIPIDMPNLESPLNCPYHLISRTPIPGLCVPTPVKVGDAPMKLLSAGGITEDIILAGGHLYRPAGGLPVIEKFDRIAASALPKVEGVIKEPLSEQICDKLTNVELAQSIGNGQSRLRELQQWMTAATVTAYSLRDRLKGVAGSKCSKEMLCDLLSAIDNPFSLRDSRIQDFSARLSEALHRGDAESVEWWNPFRAEVDEFVQEYAYSFASPAEYYDLSLWKSWSEDIDQVFRLIKAATPRLDRPSIPVLHTAALEARKHALGAICYVLDSNESQLVTSMLESTRSWIRIRYELEHKTAKVACRQRMLLKEAWSRIMGSDATSSWQDIFDLDITTLNDALIKSTDKIKLGAILARAKHKKWLETRVLPPRIIGKISEEVSITAKDTREPIPGRESFWTQFRGYVRLIDAYDQVSELHPDDVALIRYPALAWSAALCSCSGIVSEYMPEVPPESLHCTEYAIPSVYGCTNAISALSNSKRVLVDGILGFAKPI